MTKAMQSSTKSRPPTRRALFGPAAALSLLGIAGASCSVAAAAMAMTDADAELIGLCQRFEALEYRSNALYVGADSIEDDAARDVALEPIRNQQDELAERIFEMRATSAEGCRALARAAIVWAPDKIEMVAEWGDMHDLIVAPLLRSLAGEEWIARMFSVLGRGERVASAPLPTSVSPPVPQERAAPTEDEEEDEDAQILADCRRIEVLVAAIEADVDNGGDDLSPLYDRLTAEQSEVWQRLIYSTAQTWQARLAKCRAAMVMAERNEDGSISTSGASADLAFSALADAIGVAWNVFPVPPNTTVGIL